MDTVQKRTLPHDPDEAKRSAEKIGGRGTRGRGVETVYRELRREILELAIPPGTPLDETRLSARFKMSRTPVREALVRLAGEGLVTTLPNRSAIVAVIDFAQLPVYFDALTLMYRVTTRLAAENRSDGDLMEIRRHEQLFALAVEKADAPSMISTNRDFHVAIATAGRNKYFTEMFVKLLDEGRRVIRIYYRSFGDRLPKIYVDEHNAIVASIESRDVDLADRLATEHARQIVRQIQSALDVSQSRNIDLSGR